MDKNNPYKKTVFGAGAIGSGQYKISDNGVKCKAYKVWSDMVRRVYDCKYIEKYAQNYTRCYISPEFLEYQQFCVWFYENYYELDSGERVELDKDILSPHTQVKVYSSSNCIFCPQTINVAVASLKNQSNASKKFGLPIGVRYNENDKKYYSEIWDGRTKIKLGYYDTIEECFKTFKNYKEQHFRELIEPYEGLIPDKLYNAVWNWNIARTD